MQGRPLRPVVEADEPIHDAVILGWYGKEIVCCDGRYIYAKGTNGDNRPLYHYTLVPSHICGAFDLEGELRDMTLHEGFSFTKGCQVMRVPAEGSGSRFWGLQHPRRVEVLFDLENDPGQQHPLDDPELNERMRGKLIRAMEASEAPPEQYERLELGPP
jgi:hypothetical protein